MKRVRRKRREREVDDETSTYEPGFGGGAVDADAAGVGRMQLLHLYGQRTRHQLHGLLRRQQLYDYLFLRRLDDV